MKNNKFIIHPTEIAHWYFLVNESQSKLNINLSTEVESYLVFLLMRYSSQPQIFDSIISIEFLKNINNTGNVRKSKFQEIGDKCLIFCGLFPERTKNLSVNEDYFKNLGISCYSSVSLDKLYSLASLYEEMSNSFVASTKVLNSLRA